MGHLCYCCCCCCYVDVEGTVLRFVQDVLDPLQQLVSDGCHLTRRTGQSISEAGFSNVDLNMASFSNAAFINPQVYGVAHRWQEMEHLFPHFHCLFFYALFLCCRPIFEAGETLINQPWASISVLVRPFISSTGRVRSE